MQPLAQKHGSEAQVVIMSFPHIQMTECIIWGVQQSQMGWVDDLPEPAEAVSILWPQQIKGTKAFVRSYKNLHFYWILGVGHYVSP